MHPPDTAIVRRGDLADYFYIVSKGQLCVRILTPSLKEFQTRILAQSSYFGEIGLLTGSRRTATVVTQNYCILGRMGLHEFEEMCYTYFDAKEFIRKGIYTYRDDI